MARRRRRRIPILVLVLVRHPDGRFLVTEARNQGERVARCYLPGDELDHGERGEQSASYYFRETLAIELADIRPLGIVENLLYDDRRFETYHELILLYEARFAAADRYQLNVFPGHPPRGEPLEFTWRSLVDFDGTTRRLAPAALQERLTLLLA